MHRTAQDALDGLRRGLCADCVALEAIQLALQWISEELEVRYDDMRLHDLALVCRALAWAQEHWTPQWLYQVDEGLRAMPRAWLRTG